jgi:hypothetical protein
MAEAAGIAVSDAPWHADLKNFANEFKPNNSEVFDAVVFNAERNRMCHLGVTALVRKGKHAEVAELLLKDEKYVEKAFSEWPERKQSVEHTLKLLKATLFSHCEYDNNSRVQYRL